MTQGTFIFKFTFQMSQRTEKGDVSIGPAFDRGKWYNIKAQKLKTNRPVTSTPILPISGWKQFPLCTIPEHFNYGHIYHYLVDSVANFNLDLHDG